MHPSGSPQPPWAKSGKVGHAWASLGMTTPKCRTQLLPFMDVYLHAKNQSEISTTSGDTSNQRILQSDWPRALWAITREPEFSQTCGFREKSDNNSTLHFRPFPAKTNDSILRKSQKSPFLGHFGHFWGNLAQTRIFPKNRALSLFSLY